VLLWDSSISFPLRLCIGKMAQNSRILIFQTLVEMARTMLDEYRTLRCFWAEAINTSCHMFNQFFVFSEQNFL
jgi:hypothetical protein